MDQKTVGNNCKNYYEIIQKIRTKTLQLMNTPLQKEKWKKKPQRKLQHCLKLNHISLNQYLQIFFKNFKSNVQ